MHELLYRSEDRAQTPQPPPARAQLSNRNQTMKNSKKHRNTNCVTDGSLDSTIKIPWFFLILCPHTLTLSFPIFGCKSSPISRKLR